MELTQLSWRCINRNGSQSISVMAENVGDTQLQIVCICTYYVYTVFTHAQRNTTLKQL